MVASEVKRQMMALWKATFGDSDRYIELVFNRYFSLERAEWEEQNGEIVSAMLTVPYEFVCGNVRLRGVYLCGLATEMSHRRRHIMTGLIERANEKAASEGFDFTFLIPANEGIRTYYSDRGYVNNNYQLEENYVRGHRFKLSDAYEAMTVEEMIGDPSDEELGQITAFLVENQCPDNAADMSRKAGFLTCDILHTSDDWRCVIEENRLSGDSIFVMRYGLEIMGVAFGKEENNRIAVKRAILREEGLLGNLLDGIMKIKNRDNLSIRRPVSRMDLEGNKGAIWSPFYRQDNPASAEYEDVSNLEVPYSPLQALRSFGMVRLLNPRELAQKCGLASEKALIGYNDFEASEMLLRHPESTKDNLAKLLEVGSLDIVYSLLLD